MSPDREIVGPEKVIVLEQFHYAKRGPVDQGGRGSKHRTERSRSRDPPDRDTRHANQRGGASASSGTNVRPPSPERHPVGMLPVSCSEDEQGPPVSPCSPRGTHGRPAERSESVDAVFRAQVDLPGHDSSSSSSEGSQSSSETVEVGQLADNWETPLDRDYGRVAWSREDWNFICHERDDNSVPHEAILCAMCGYGFNINTKRLKFWAKCARTCHLPVPAWTCGGSCQVNYSGLPRRPVEEHRERYWRNQGIYERSIGEQAVFPVHARDPNLPL